MLRTKVNHISKNITEEQASFTNIFAFFLAEFKIIIAAGYKLWCLFWISVLYTFYLRATVQTESDQGVRCP